MVIITGASDGLGLAIAKLLISKDKKVLSLSRTCPPIKEIDWIKTDLLDDLSIVKSVNTVIASSNKIEALINCAAVTSYEDTNKITSKELERMFRTNVTAPILLTSRLLDKIKQDGADIVNIGATIALRSGSKDQSVYSTTKWALRGFTQNLASDLKQTTCRVISFILGAINSKMHEKETGEPITDPENRMNLDDIAVCLVQLLELPKNIEVSEIIVNRKINN